jgi:hypothetical protein
MLTLKEYIFNYIPNLTEFKTIVKRTALHIPEGWLVFDLMGMNHHPNPVPVSPSYVDDHPFHSTVHRDQSPANKRGM